MSARLAMMATWLLGAMFQAPAHGQCQYLDQPAEAARTGQSAVNVSVLSPADGGEVTKATIISVDIEYHIENYSAGEYFVSAIFATGGWGGMMPGVFEAYPSLLSATGNARICIPLTEVYEHPRMQWPLSMRVNLMRREGDSTVSMASSRPFSFRANDVPPGALERQAAAPPPEYHDALMNASGYFRQRAVMYKLCIEKHPAMQPAFTRAYRDWETRHRADIHFVNQVQFESYREQVGGRADIATRIDDQATASQRASLERLPAAEFKKQCDWTLEDLAESDDLTDGAIGDELEIVRKYAPTLVEGSE